MSARDEPGQASMSPPHPNPPPPGGREPIFPGPLLQRYGHPPAETEALSLQRVDAALQRGLWADASGLSEARPSVLSTQPSVLSNERQVVRRIAYACGDPEIAGLVRFHPEAVNAGVAALRAGAPIVVDVQMVEVALDRETAQRLGCRVHRAIHHLSVAREAQARGLSRAAVAIQRLAPRLPGSIAVIGTAPTALLALLDLVDAGRARPSLIIGMPVGLVAAADAKAELAQRSVPFITIVGTRGGAALAAATANALPQIARASEE